MAQKLGGWKQVDISPEIQDICDAVKDQVEQEAQKKDIKLEKYEAVSARTQVVAGLKVYAKIHIGEGHYMFIKVWRKVNRTYELLETEFNKDVDDTLA